MTASTYSVLLLEDEKATRQRLASLISTHPNLTLFGEADCCDSARNLLQENAPDILMADIGLPDGSGIDIIREAQQKYPRMEVMVLTVFEDEQSVVEALEAGATGYLLKEHAFEQLGESVMALMQGESTISPKVARFLLKRFTPAAAEKPRSESNNRALTERECQVLELIAKGYSYNEVGDSLKLSTNTIRAHIRNIYRKLAVKSRSEAVFEAAQLGLIELKGTQ
jgi:DNA-binding NarL/FixJ family response regulator